MATSDNDPGRSSATAVLLFEPGRRPASQTIQSLAAMRGNFAVSFDPAQQGEGSGDGEEGQGRWLELLANGLTFDLVGLAPGQPTALPPCGHRFGLSDDDSPARLEAVTLRPGPHLAGGARMIPVIRSLAWLAAELADLPGVRVVAWPAGRIWCGPDHFRGAVLRWSEGGVFPGLGLAALAVAADGGMQSEGMALFIGQELRIEPDLVHDRATGAKLGVRLLHWLFEHGPVAEPQIVAGPDGEELRLAPSPNGQFVRVWRD